MIPLFHPYMPAVPDAMQILQSTQLAYGPETKKFEQSLRNYLQTPFVLAVQSASIGIAIVASVLNLRYGDEIILSPIACVASTMPYASLGLKLVWCDIDPHTGTLDPHDLEAKITPKTKAIIHNHFCGYPGYVLDVNTIAHCHGIPVIDDGIECFGSEADGNKIGHCGSDATVFSFSAVRLPNTIEGGAIVLRDKLLYDQCMLIRDYGIDRSKFRDSMGEINLAYDIDTIGYNGLMSNFNGYLGWNQMEHVPRLIAQQRKQADIWRRRLGNSHYQSVGLSNTIPNYWVYGILSSDKQDCIEQFRREGYYASGVHINNARYRIFDCPQFLPGADEFERTFVALPCGWWME